MLPTKICASPRLPKEFQSMEISSSLRIVSSLSSSPKRPPLLKVGGLGIDSPCGLTSPRSPTAEIQRKKRMVMASATFSYGTRNSRGDDTIVVSRNEKQSHYTLLGVPENASQEDIRSAYRKLALQFHPDVVPIHQLKTATKHFSEINRAYQTLSDPQERKAYDDLNLISTRAHNGRVAGFSSYPYSSSSSRGRQWRGRNWETDQCWC